MLRIAEDMEIKTLAGGSNFLRVGSMLSLGLIGYNSRLPKGTTASVHNMHPGIACIEGLRMVDEGKYDFAITSPAWFANSAAEGRIALGWTPRKLNLSAVASISHDDQLALAVRKDLGIKSIREIRENKIPLRISTGPYHFDHPLGCILDLVLAEYDIKIEDFEAWGGSTTCSDRQLNVMAEGRADSGDRVSSIRAGRLDAVFDEGIMSKTWKDIADTVDLEFLPIDEDVLDSLERKYGMRRSVLRKGRLRGIDQDVPTIDFAGWLLYCHSEMPDDVVYYALIGLEESKQQLDSLFAPQVPFQGISEFPINMRTLGQDTVLPLHPGAEMFYRERGYLNPAS